MKKRIALAVIVGCLFLVPSVSAAMFWGRSFVQVGDSSYSVLKKCGRPNYQETISVGIDGMGKTTEKWHYDRGSKSIPHTLTIRNGSVRHIKLESRF